MLVEQVVQAINENPALVLRALREGLKIALHDEAFKQELIATLAACADIKVIDPLYDKKLAMRLVPCGIHQFNRLSKALSLKPPYYRLLGDAHRRHRLFYASDIEKIRKALSAPFKEDTKIKFGSSARRAQRVGRRGSATAY